MISSKIALGHLELVQFLHITSQRCDSKLFTDVLLMLSKCVFVFPFTFDVVSVHKVAANLDSLRVQTIFRTDNHVQLAGVFVSPVAVDFCSENNLAIHHRHEVVTGKTCPGQCPEICAVCNIPQSMTRTTLFVPNPGSECLRVFQ